MQIVALVPLAAGRVLTRRLSAPWAVSLDARVPAGSELTVSFGSRRIVVRSSRHIEETGPHASALVLRAAAGFVRVSALIISDAADRGSLLLHRLAELHARLEPGQFPIGADTRNRLRLSSTYWTSGFWPGALWQAAALEPAHGVFEDWALDATIHHFGQERSDTHDVGFMYGESSLAAWQAECAGSRVQRAPARLCARLRRSALSAADELVRLAASNSRAGTIPTSSSGPQADTIVDSMMNIGILPWATRVTHNPAYAALAARHARRVAATLVRPDGSTTQAVNFDRATGRVVSLATHQGISRTSTWSRGEGWALYGFAQAALGLRDRGLLRVADRVARYVAARVPAAGVPRWDYDAPPGAPVDVSAGVITAAGFMRLAAACRELEAPCAGASRWVALSRRMLVGSLRHASAQPPLGFLRSQVLNERAHRAWFNGGELIFGLTYALEALRLQR